MLIINLFLFILSGLFLLLLAVSAIREKEKRAIIFSFIGLLLNSALWIGFILFAHSKPMAYLNAAAAAVLLLFFIISQVKFFPAGERRDISAAEKYDERDNMFARNHLQFHPELAAAYYTAHPGKKEIDLKIQAKPEIGEPGSAFYDYYGSPIIDTAFAYLARTRFASMGEKNEKKKEFEKERLTETIEYIARLYGAVDVGITALQPYHFYSRAGRHKEGWGNAVESTHRTAVIIVVAMNIDMIKKAPALSAASETSRRYVEAAGIADIIAHYIRFFGYDARAHTDANYQVLCVPLAVDSGLGVLGRLGILIHPVYGPCLRLAVVTSDIELLPTKKYHACSIEYFCKICKKCAENCPSKSIAGGEEPSSRGFRHWSIDQEKCFSLWKSYGTDCGVCIKVCPYTKPNTLVHKIVRFYISRNSLNQRIALFFDNLLYGRIPNICQNSKNRPHRPFFASPG